MSSGDSQQNGNSGSPLSHADHQIVNPGFERQWRLRSAAHVILMVILSAVLLQFAPNLGLWSTQSARDLFSVVIDAGSTGSRVFVFHFKAITGDFENHNLVRLESEFFQSVEPGISSYSKKPQEAADSLKPMLKKSLKHIPPEYHEKTLVMLKATAGLRLLPEQKAEEILHKIRQLLVSSPYHLPDPSKVMVMSGEEEGLFGWVTVNFLLDVLWDSDDDNTVTAFDLGGGSMQITFELKQAQIGDYPVKDIFRLKLMHESFNIFTHSYLKYGLKSARLAIIGAEKVSTKSDAVDSAKSVVTEDGSIMVYSDTFFEGAYFDFTHGETNYTVRGTNPQPDSLSAVMEALKPFVDAAHFIQGEALSKRELHLFSYFFDVARWAKIVPWNVHHYKLTPDSYLQAAKSYCLHKKFSAKHPFLCIDLVYIYTVLTRGVGLPVDKEITVETRLLGREVSWSLGAALSTLSEDFSYEQLSSL